MLSYHLEEISIMRINKQHLRQKSHISLDISSVAIIRVNFYVMGGKRKECVIINIYYFVVYIYIYKMYNNNNILYDTLYTNTHINIV